VTRPRLKQEQSYAARRFEGRRLSRDPALQNERAEKLFLSVGLFYRAMMAAARAAGA
jgi:hypothetical protein